MPELSTCLICADPRRYEVEQSYLESRSDPRYGRIQVERHMAHVADPAVLRQVTNLSSASAVASRLRQLEVAAATILDVAIQQKDGKLAIAALREARATLVEMAKLTAALEHHGEGDESRPDLDDAIAGYVGGVRRERDEPEPPLRPLGPLVLESGPLYEPETDAAESPGTERPGQSGDAVSA